MSRRYPVRQVTARDRAILHWIGRGGIAAASQLLRRFWPGCRPETARDRLQQLVKAGYLDQHYADARRAGEVVYTLTPTGRRLFPADTHPGLQTGLPPAGEIRQQLVAQDAYLYLEREAQMQGGQVTGWHGEHALRSTFYRAPRPASHPTDTGPPAEIPDAQVHITRADGQRDTVDVEIDGQYQGQMLRRKLERFGCGGRPTVWVCTSVARATRIRHAALPYPNIRVIVVA